MCWTDKIATQEILKLCNEFNVQTAIATGTFIGADIELYAHFFNEVYSVDIETKYLEIARKRLQKYNNITLTHMNSWEFLELFVDSYEIMRSRDIIYFYLDAHFYDPSLAQKDKWVIIKELQALRGFDNCIICIHDFDCEGLGHLIYGGEHLGWSVISKYITKVNPDFYYYTNTREWCDIYNEETVKGLPITIDEYILDGLKFTNSSDVKKYRGILYAVPRELDLSYYRLKAFYPPKI